MWRMYSPPSVLMWQSFMSEWDSLGEFIPWTCTEDNNDTSDGNDTGITTGEDDEITNVVNHSPEDLKLALDNWIVDATPPPSNSTASADEEE